MSKPALHLTVHIDGGSRGNPGPAAAGVVVAALDGTVLHESGIFLGRATNNVAEYRGLLAGLAAAKRLGGAEVEIVSDSELLVRQMNGQYKVKNAKLRPLFEQAQALAQRFEHFTCQHVRREANAEADEMARRAIHLRRDLDGD